MSKKKRAAKLAKAEARKALIDGRVEAAWADFEGQFEDPYGSPEEFEAEREMCLKSYRAEVTKEVESPAFFDGDETDMAFAPWIMKFRDKMVTKHRSEAIVDPRVRFQVARLFQNLNRVPVGAHNLKLVVTFIKRFPLFPSQIYDDPLGIGDIDPRTDLSRARNPYKTREEAEADVEFVRQAWRTEYGDDALGDDFCPPLFVTDDEGVLAAPWMGEFRDHMVRKYGSLKVAEPRIRYIINGIIPSMVDRRGSGLLQTRTIEEEEQLEALIDRVGGMQER